MPSAFITEDAYDGSSAKWIPEGALVMALAGQGKTKGMVAQLGIAATCNQSMAAILPLEETLSRYLFWWLNSNYQNIRNMAGGDDRDGLNLELLGDIVCPVPPLLEQAAVVTFLDRETAKIDALVEQQKRLIELLKEKRQVVISHAVTQGLYPGALMKDSGIEWLGQVPEHWELRSISSVSTKITNGYVGPTREILVDSGVRYLQSLHIKGNRILFETRYHVTPEWSEAHSKSVLQNGDVLIVQTGDIGQVAVVSEEFAGCNCHALIIVTPLPGGMSGDWLSWVLNAPYGLHSLLAIQTGALHPHLNCGNVKNIVVPVPPLDEQTEIVRKLESDLSKLDELAGSAEDAVKLLQERRAALISAAVTGKIDVRGQATTTVLSPDFSRSRKLVAAKIVEELSGQKTFGRVKLQKLLYLAEAHGGIHELSGHYVREAAGPLDRDMVREVETDLQNSGHVVIEQPEGRGTAVNYQLRGTRGAFQAELETLLGDRISALSELIETVGALDTRGAEAVATLYAVWNDALASSTVPSDDEIIREVLTEWHPKKAETFTVADLKHWLAWMRRNGLKPKGNATVTSTGRLFV